MFTTTLKNIQLGTDLSETFVTHNHLSNYLSAVNVTVNTGDFDALATQVSAILKHFGGNLDLISDPGSGPFLVNNKKKYETLTEAINVVNNSSESNNIISVLNDVNLNETEVKSTKLRSSKYFLKANNIILPTITKSLRINLGGHTITTNIFGENNILFNTTNTISIENGQINPNDLTTEYSLVSSDSLTISNISAFGKSIEFIKNSSKDCLISDSLLSVADGMCLNIENTKNVAKIIKSTIGSKYTIKNNNNGTLLINGSNILIEGSIIECQNGGQTINISKNGGTCSCEFWTDAKQRDTYVEGSKYIGSKILYTLNKDLTADSCGACVKFDIEYTGANNQLSASNFYVGKSLVDVANFYMTQTIEDNVREYSTEIYKDLPMIAYKTDGSTNYNLIKIEQLNGFYNRYKIGDISQNTYGSEYLIKDFSNIRGGVYTDTNIEQYLAPGYLQDLSSSWNIYQNALFEVSSVEKLIELKELVGTAQGLSCFDVKQTVDLNLKDYAWSGIGVSQKSPTKRNTFWGIYDGQGHSINNLAFERTDKMGLFGSIAENSVVKNLTINLDPETDGFRGNITNNKFEFGAGVVTYELLQGAKIENVTTTGTLGSNGDTEYVDGGNVGRTSHNSAGIAVLAIPSLRNNAKKTSIINCTNKVNIWCQYTKAAGILGYAAAEGYGTSAKNGFVLIQNCRNNGNINNSNSKNPNDQGGTGGIVGWNGNDGSNCEIDGCENTGLVTRAEHSNINVDNGFGQICGYRNSYIQIYKRLPAYARSDIQTLPVFMGYDNGVNNQGFEYPNAPVVHMPIHLVMEDGRISLTEDINDAKNQDGTKTFKIMAPHKAGHHMALKEPHTITLHNPGAKVNIDYSLFNDMREYINVVCDNTETNCEIITTENNNVVTYEAKAV